MKVRNVLLVLAAFFITHSALAAGKAPKSVGPDIAQAASAAGTATISGKVMLEGAAPAREKIKMNADPACMAQHKDPVFSEQVVAENGALQNVLVYIKEKPTGNYPAPTTPVVLDQVGCQYHPHVFGIQTGQPLEIRNSDSTLHNINCQAKANKKFNIAQPTKGMKTTKMFDKAELGVPFKCNVHPWMVAYAAVFDHPFFGVTGTDGGFTLSNLPAGTYAVEAWHEKYGTSPAQSVTVADGETKQVSFSFKAQ